MSKFVFEGQTNPGDGSRHPLGKKVKRALFNIKVSLLRNKREDEVSVHHVDKALKR